MLYEYDVHEYVACMFLARGVGIFYFYNLKTYVMKILHHKLERNGTCMNNVWHI